MGLPRLLIFLAVAVLILNLTSAGTCPPKNKVYNNKPACFSDADCQKYGKICCPNAYNTKSCTDRAPFLKKSFDKEAQLSSHSSRNIRALKKPRVYCEGFKCLPTEVCRLNSLTRKYECMRV